jgi:hypothetical protein
LRGAIKPQRARQREPRDQGDLQRAFRFKESVRGAIRLRARIARILLDISNYTDEPDLARMQFGMIKKVKGGII